MLRRLLLLDACLVAVLALGVMKLREDARAFGPTHDVSAIQPKPQTFPALERVSAADAAQAANWTEISSRNPFSFDRSDIDIVAAEPVTVAAKPPAQKPVLFGTLLVGAERLALIGAGPAGNGARQMKAGDTIDGWTIVEIGKKSIQIEANGASQTVIMNDPTAQTPRDYGRTAVSGANAATPAPAPNAPSSSAVSADSRGNAPAASVTGQKKTRVVQTIFGPRVIEDTDQ